jgi:hypothetical protein
MYRPEAQAIGLKWSVLLYQLQRTVVEKYVSEIITSNGILINVN